MRDLGSFREIHESVQNLVRPNQLFADAVDVRQVSTFPHSSRTFSVFYVYITVNIQYFIIQINFYSFCFGFFICSSVCIYIAFTISFFDSWVERASICTTIFFHLFIVFPLCWELKLIPTLLQEIDLRIGASFTRFQTMLLRDAFVLDFAADDRNLVLSYGPCQVRNS